MPRENSMTDSAYPKKYQKLIDAETWAFIEKTNSFYPPDTIDNSIDEQRKIYNNMCAGFFAGYPKGVTSSDSVISTPDHQIPIRSYSLAGSKPKADVVYYHGGGFVVGGLDSHDDVCAEICGLTGFNVTSVDYRLGA